MEEAKKRPKMAHFRASFWGLAFSPNTSPCSSSMVEPSLCYRLCRRPACTGPGQYLPFGYHLAPSTASISASSMLEPSLPFPSSSHLSHLRSPDLSLATALFEAPEQTLHHFLLFFMFRSKLSITFGCFLCPSPPSSPEMHLKGRIFFFLRLRCISGQRGGRRGQTAKSDGGFAPAHQKHPKVMEGLLRSLDSQPFSHYPEPRRANPPLLFAVFHAPEQTLHHFWLFPSPFPPPLPRDAS